MDYVIVKGKKYKVIKECNMSKTEAGLKEAFVGN